GKHADRPARRPRPPGQLEHQRNAEHEEDRERQRRDRKRRSEPDVPMAHEWRQYRARCKGGGSRLEPALTDHCDSALTRPARRRTAPQLPFSSCATGMKRSCHEPGSRFTVPTLCMNSAYVIAFCGTVVQTFSVSVIMRVISSRLLRFSLVLAM